MAKLEFETTMRSENKATDLKGSICVEKKRINYIGVNTTSGVKIQVLVEGPCEQVDALFNTFPLGAAAKNIAVNVTLTCSQSTISSALAAAMKREKKIDANADASNGDNGDPTQTDADTDGNVDHAAPNLTALDKALDAATQ